MSEFIARRIAKDLGQADLVELLADKMPASDLHSLLLAAMKRRVSKLSPSRLLDLDNAATLASDVSSRLMNQVEAACYAAAPQFDAIELAPTVPLGSVATLTGLDQSNVLSTIRSLECASDPTISLALECARQRKSAGNRKGVTKLCSSHRLTRFPLPTTPGYSGHFKLFSLVSAGRDVGSYAFELEALREHIDAYLSLVEKMREIGFAAKGFKIELSDTRVVSHMCSRFNIDRDEIRSSVRARDASSSQKLLDKYGVNWPETIARPSEELAQYELYKYLMVQLSRLEERVMTPLQEKYKEAHIYFSIRRLTGLGYYDGPCFHIKMQNDRGESFMVADGGLVKWTQLLLGDGKERFMTSAIGTEMMCRLFRTSV